MLQNHPTTTTKTTTTAVAVAVATTNQTVTAGASLQPKVVVIRRRPNQGFGFTLRHFIAYPPEDDDENDDDGTWAQDGTKAATVAAAPATITTTTSNVTQQRQQQKKQQVKAMETIFIKEVQPNGPAHYANLQTGDRVLMVNNQPIAGIAYSTIVSMIKQTPSVLTLHVVPKECDVLQMHYTSIAHTPESNRSSATAATLASFKPTTAGYGNGTTAGATKSFSTQQQQQHQQQQQQLISYTSSGNNRLIGGANSLRTGEYNETTTTTTTTASVHQHQQQQQQQQQLQHYQQQQQQSALVLRGESGFTLRNNVQAPNVTVLSRNQQQTQQLQQQHQQVSSIYASDNSDLMIRLRESIKQKEEFLKSPLPHTHHPHSQQPQQQQQQSQQQHFFPSQTPPAGSPQLSMVSNSSGSVGARGQVRTLVKQPLSAASSNASSTRELLPGSYDLHNFYAKNLSFDSMMNRHSTSTLTEKTLTSSASAYSALSTARLEHQQQHQQQQSRQSATNGNGKYAKELDYMETLQETGGVTNKVFESKLVSHMAKGFDPFKPLSIQTTAGNVAMDATGTNNVRKSGVLYESLHQHPLHQMQLQTNNNAVSSMEQKTSGKYGHKSPEREEKSNQHVDSNTASDMLSGLKATTDAVVRRFKPLTAFDDGNKLMRRISYLRATNNENEYPSDSSSIATTATTATTNSGGNGSVAMAPLVATSEHIDEDADLDADADPLYDVVAVDRVNELHENDKLHTPDSAKIGIRRISLSSDIRNSVHTDNLICEFETFETKDVNTEMEVFETEMEIKATTINGKRPREFGSWRLAKIEIRGDILTIHSSRNTKSENNVIELDIRNLQIFDESADKKKYIFRIQSKPPLYLDDGPEKLTSSGSSSSATAMQSADPQQHPYTDILFKTKSITEMKRIFGLLQWKNSLIFDDSDLQGKQLAEPQKTAASASMPTATYCDENVQQQQQQQQQSTDYSPRITGGGGDGETSDSISPVMKARKSTSHKNLPDKDLGSPKAKNWKDLLFRRGGGNSTGNSSGADISPSSLAGNMRTTGSIGVPLKLCQMSKNNEFVPQLVDACTNIVETKGLGVVGIYRIPGNKAAISELSEQVNRQDFSWDRCTTDVRWEDVNVVSSLLKLFIRSLPDALLPTSFYNLFIEADKKTGLVRLKELKNLLESLPRHSYETMKHLIRHLSRVSKNCDVNLMEPKNLAIIFGPSIIRTPNDTLEIAVKDMKHQCRIVELLVTQYDYFFENGSTPDVADICGNGNGINCSLTTSTASGQSQEEQTNMLLDNVSKIERFTERESSRTSRFIPALRRRTHSKRSAVSSADTYSGESVVSLDYSHAKTVTASSSSSSSTNITTALAATSANSSTNTVVTTNIKKKERGFLSHNQRTHTHYRKASLDEKDSAGSGSNSGGSIGKMEQRSSVDISILLTDDDESCHSRISDTGSMSLTTITDTLDTKLRNLRSGSESNDENCATDLLKNRRHTLGQPLHLHAENIPYADESPERHFHATHPLDVASPNKSHKISRNCTADAKAVLDKPRSLLTPGALTYKNHKLQHSATVPISSSGLNTPPAAASTPTGLKNSNMPCVSTATLPPSGGVLGRNFYAGKNLRFSSSVYEHCCSEDDSEGSTTSDPKESNLIINSPSYLIDRYNKKRRDHRLFRSASFNCRNYSTRHGHAHIQGGSSSGGTPTAGLTKDEKTDMNLTKKRQIQNKQNRSIKRRHTVGGPHDYSNPPPAAYPNATTVVGNNCHHAHKTSSSLARRIPLSNANGNLVNNNNNNGSDNGNSSAGSSGAGDGVDGSSSGVSSGGNEAPSRATVAVAAPGGEHVLEVGIRIKNINRNRY